MKREEFFDMVEGLYKYLRYYDVPSSRILDEWHTEVKHMDSKAIPFLISRFKLMRNLPRNIPLEMKSFYRTWEVENLKSTPVDYDPVEDSRYPVSKLERAVSIYLQEGQKAFKKYCDKTGMPSRDREACTFQAKSAKRGIKLDKISDRLIKKISNRPSE